MSVKASLVSGTIALPIIYMTQLPVDNFVRPVPSVILKNVLENSNQENYQKRDKRHFLPNSFNSGDKVQQGYEEEIDIGPSVKLFK
jgi:hypothetical protein